MKNYLLIALGFICSEAIAQAPVITEADIASEGQSFTITNANPVIVFDGDDTGADHNWDFSSLTPVTSDTSMWIDEEDTDPFYFFLWLSSDIAEQTTSDINTDYFTIEDVFNFYAKDNNSLEMSGFAGTIADVPLPIIYDDNDVIYEFPLEFGNSYSSVSSFAIEIPGLGAWREQRTRNNEADGWGNVSTPYGSFNALRIKSVSEIVDTFVYDAIEIPFSYTTTEYKWLTIDGGIPVLQINMQNILGADAITQVMYREDEIFSSINSGESLPSISMNTIGSNDLSVTINNAGDDKMNYVLYAISGETIMTGGLNSGNNLIPLSQLSSGLYLFAVKNESGIISVQKFIHED